MTGVLAPPPVSRWDQVKAFLVILVSFTMVLGAVAGMHFYIHFATERGALESREWLNVGLAQHTLANNIFGVVSDLMFLAEDIESQGLPDRNTPGSAVASPRNSRCSPATSDCTTKSAT